LTRLFGKPFAEAPDTPPNDMQVLNRSAEDAPPRVSVEIGSVDPADLEIYHTALRAYGVSEKRITQMKALDGLAKDWATHLSISLRGHHQSYDGQLHNLAEVAEDIKERLKGTKMEDGSYQPLDAETYSWLSKVYVECVKESGKGVGMMLTLTEALVRMIGANKDHGAAPKATAGWGPMKKVRPAK